MLGPSATPPLLPHTAREISQALNAFLHHELAFKMKPSLVDSRLIQAGRRRGRSKVGHVDKLVTLVQDEEQTVEILF